MRSLETNIIEGIIVLALAVLGIWGLVVLFSNPLVQALAILVVVFVLVGMLKGSKGGRGL